ncbi:DUF4832 domain-containing protein [Merismopedia glauca]|uniref:DUF4832 domain-containing protein n=1 Tax=Merismopedia glauca CCAP 1448/3 TaxID=1296344 RepID=A0A2T1C9N4_9CYAN|nr:DUF4832 domain-containing protein [Merismopedia glauca]PSB04853.1 hypothetical protein C7B64_01830 [Merismopedia glauca CCAP 1448/3]
MFKQTIKQVFIPLTLLSSIASFPFACQAAPVTQNYEVTYENLVNPERGFFVPTYPNALNKLAPLTLTELQQVRANKMSLMRRYYLLDQFRNSPISQSFIDSMRNDFKLAREAGVKLILRFSYNYVGGGPDTSRNQILAHLDQLRPVFVENYDVIAYLHAGFIGKYGEWHNSTNNLVNPEDTRTIVFKIMSVLPKERMVAIRYPKRKMEIFNSNQPLNAQEAFTGTNRARAANNNQCFLAAFEDWGTYSSVWPAEIEAEKQYLRSDNQYVVQGGETCNSDSEAQPYITCQNATKEMAKLRFSDLNSKYEPDVLKKWQTDGCMAKIQRSLGYRFYLSSSAIPSLVKPGGNFDMSFIMGNSGWANPYNPRLLEIVMRNRATRAEYYVRVNQDPRRWLPGTKNQVDISAGIPTNMPAGTYDIFLNLPDPASKLYGKPEFSIRLANKNVWEATSGYNSFLRTVTVDPNAVGNNYSGTSFFQSR